MRELLREQLGLRKCFRLNSLIVSVTLEEGSTRRKMIKDTSKFSLNP